MPCPNAYTFLRKVKQTALSINAVCKACVSDDETVDDDCRFLNCG